NKTKTGTTQSIETITTNAAKQESKVETLVVEEAGTGAKVQPKTSTATEAEVKPTTEKSVDNATSSGKKKGNDNELSSTEGDP
ncbi:hypothetical protein, partial [Xenorhabdus bovienii]|uniref:hypothetical protein n=1 Tax=Xenorhabdus bovienii TaxID=40576 RepID=UPI0023B267D4